METVPPELAILAVNMPLGTSMREICPRCGGGTKREKSLSLTLTEDGNLLWKCHRASCNDAGKLFVWGVIGEGRKAAKKAPRLFTARTEHLSKAVYDWFFEKYQIRAGILDEYGIKFCADMNRVVIPITGPPNKYRIRGYLAREWADKLDIKSLTFQELVEEPFAHWGYQFTAKYPIILVEDIISALKIEQANLNVISLNGTNLSQKLVREIIDVNRKVIIALDKDAYSKAIGMAGSYSQLLDIKVWKLEEDLKYVPEERILDAYFKGKTDFSEG